jgi:hypothetical protein
MDTGAMPHVCGVFLMVLMFNSQRWFMLCLVYISYFVLVLESRDRGLAPSIGPS